MDPGTSPYKIILGRYFWISYSLFHFDLDCKETRSFLFLAADLSVDEIVDAVDEGVLAILVAEVERRSAIGLLVDRGNDLLAQVGHVLFILHLALDVFVLSLLEGDSLVLTLHLDYQLQLHLSFFDFVLLDPERLILFELV